MLSTIVGSVGSTSFWVKYDTKIVGVQFIAHNEQESSSQAGTIHCDPTFHLEGWISKRLVLRVEVDRLKDGCACICVKEVYLIGVDVQCEGKT